MGRETNQQQFTYLALCEDIPKSEGYDDKEYDPRFVLR